MVSHPVFQFLGCYVGYESSLEKKLSMRKTFISVPFCFVWFFSQLLDPEVLCLIGDLVFWFGEGFLFGCGLVFFQFSSLLSLKSPVF